ncbi:MAG: AsmA-like C-terminal region-containing protein [Rickettsiales bacterium]
MKRKFLVLFIIFGISAELIFIVNKLLAASKKKDTIAEYISNNLGAKAEIKGKIELDFFPRPKFVISHLRLYDYKIKNYNINIRATTFEASVPILNLLGGDIDLQEITIKDAKITYSKIRDSDKINESNILEFPYKKIHINNSDVSYYNDLNQEIKYSNLDFTIKNIAKLTEFSGSFTKGISNYKFNLNIKDDGSENLLADLLLDFTGGTLKLSSNYDKKNQILTGNVDINGDDIQKLIFNNFFSVWFLYPDKRQFSYNATFDFTKENNTLSVNNGEITGEAVQGSFSGSVVDNDLGGMNFSFSKLNLDAITSNYKQNFIKEEMATMNFAQQQNFFQINKEVLISGLFDTIIIKDKEIGPVKIEMMLNKNLGLNIKELSFQVNENNYNSLQGGFSQENNQYIFKGSISSTGANIKELIRSLYGINFIDIANDQDQQYNINAKLELHEDQINLDNIEGFFGDSVIKGLINYNIAEQSDSKIELNLSNVNFNNYLLISENDRYRHIIHSLYENLAKRENTVSLLQKFLWLRNVFSNIHFELNFDNIIFNNDKIDNFTTSGRVSYRVLDIENLNINSLNNNINANIMVNLDSIEPFVNIDLQAEQADLSLLDYAEEYKNISSGWSNDFILFPNFENLNLIFKSNFKKLSYNEISIRNSSFNFDIEDNILNIKSASGDIDKGSFDIKGNFIMDGLPQLSLSYNLDQFYLSNLLKFLFNIDNIDSLVNLAGTLQTYGNTPYIMMKQLKSKNRYFASNITVDRLALPKIIQDIADLSSKPKSKFTQPISKEIRAGKTNLNSITGDLDVVNGVILINNIRFSLKGLEMATAGKIDMVNKLIKINSIIKFIAKYKSNKGIKQTPLTITHSLEGNFNNLKGTYDLFQLKTFTENLKSSYIKLLNKLETNN